MDWGMQLPTDETVVIVGRRGPKLQAYTFCETVEQAEAKRADAERFYDQPVEIMTYAEFDQLETAYWDQVLAQPPTVITAEQFDYALNVLPPHNFHTGDGFTTFTMSELREGPYTEQYAALRYEGETQYYSKLVDVFRRETWMTRASLLTLEVR